MTRHTAEVKFVRHSPTSGVGISIGGQAGSQIAFLLDGQGNNSRQISTDTPARRRS